MPIRPENRDRYPVDWPAISSWIRFVRAEERCECVGECERGTHDGRCPNRHREPAYDSGSIVFLTTAHLDHQPRTAIRRTSGPCARLPPVLRPRSPRTDSGRDSSGGAGELDGPLPLDLDHTLDARLRLGGSR